MNIEYYTHLFLNVVFSYELSKTVFEVKNLSNKDKYGIQLVEKCMVI